jgi:diguanylate cyclase (GGDEF)-like protein
VKRLDALRRLARLTLAGPASEEALREAADILRRATAATGAALVYAEDQDFLVCESPGATAGIELSQVGLGVVQRQVVRLHTPVGFDVCRCRLEDFASAETEPRDYLAFAIPFSGSSSEMCVLRGSWDEKAWAAVVRFAEAAIPSLALLTGRFLNAEHADRQRKQLAALASAGQVLIHSDDVASALEDMATAMAASTGYDFVTIDVYDASAERFTLRIISKSRMSGGSLAGFWRKTLDPDEPEPRYLRVVQVRKPVLLPDLQNDPRVPEPSRDFFRRSLLRSSALFPLLFQDEVLGVMSVVSFRPHSFPEDEVRYLEGLAAEVATALKAMRTHRELVESQKELQRYARRVERQRTELAKSQAQLKEKSALLERALQAERENARRDPLTGVLNHAAIVEELRSLISDSGEGTPCAIAMIDVDDLKAINDTFGHQVGDAVLVAVADAIARDGALVGRYGGDEFVAVLPGADRNAAERYRERVLQTLAGTVLCDPETGSSVQASASVGLAAYPTEAGRIEELIDLADSGMYGAKRQRPVSSTSMAVSQPLGDERAAKMVGEIVPLLTSPGELSDKLRLVAHRLSVAAGYDAVSFTLFAADPKEPTVVNTFGRLPKKMLNAWKEQLSKPGHDECPIRLLMRQGRPLILSEPQHDQRLTERERGVLRAAGIRSAMIAPMLWQNELIGSLSVAAKRESAFAPRDAQFLVAVASQVSAIVRMGALVEGLQSASDRLAEAQAETVMLLAASAEAHDEPTGAHLQNVCAITEALAGELGYSERDAKELGLAAVLHDIGKIRVPDIVLSNAGELTDNEWDLLRQHTVWGAEFLAGRPGFELAATIARSHHERWDGSGYPDGLSGEAIPESVAIVSVADAFDAMTSDRPYRGARSIARALNEIVDCSGTQFSPRVVRALVRLHERGEAPLADAEHSGEGVAA